MICFKEFYQELFYDVSTHQSSKCVCHVLDVGVVVVVIVTINDFKLESKLLRHVHFLQTRSAEVILKLLSPPRRHDRSGPSLTPTCVGFSGLVSQ